MPLSIWAVLKKKKAASPPPSFKTTTWKLLTALEQVLAIHVTRQSCVVDVPRDVPIGQRRHSNPEALINQVCTILDVLGMGRGGHINERRPVCQVELHFGVAGELHAGD